MRIPFDPWLDLTDTARADMFIRAATNALLDAESKTVAAVRAVVASKDLDNAFDAVEKARAQLHGLHCAVVDDLLARDHLGELFMKYDALNFGAEVIMDAIGFDRATANDVIRRAAVSLARYDKLRGEAWMCSFEHCWQRGDTSVLLEFHIEEGRVFVIEIDE